MSSPTPQQALPGLLRLPYALYAGTLFTVLSLLALVLILPVPSLPARRAMVRCAARAFLALAGMRLTVLNQGRLPQAPCVVVANHSSYLDGVALYAALPPRFGFVIKREMSRVPLANLLLRRVGAHYVDRGRGHKGARDTRKLLKRARQGGALAFFPEGTFRHAPGLMAFRSGAFVVAARSGFPVVPVAIRGTRAALPPGGMLPQPVPIEVELLEMIPAPSSIEEAAVSAVRRAARTAILAHIAEPDLAPDDKLPA
ncbi:MAG: lysophospholipid acyltransferase family protein [Steroidobacteraceae bacterium]